MKDLQKFKTHVYYEKRNYIWISKILHSNKLIFNSIFPTILKSLYILYIFIIKNNINTGCTLLISDNYKMNIPEKFI